MYMCKQISRKQNKAVSYILFDGTSLLTSLPPPPLPLKKSRLEYYSVIMSIVKLTNSVNAYIENVFLECVIHKNLV